MPASPSRACSSATSRCGRAARAACGSPSAPRSRTAASSWHWRRCSPRPRRVDEPARFSAGAKEQGDERPGLPAARWERQGRDRNGLAVPRSHAPRHAGAGRERASPPRGVGERARARDPSRGLDGSAPARGPLEQRAPRLARGSRFAPGVILIAIGVLLFSLQLSNAGGQYAVALIGAAFLAAYAIWRVYGLLIPGGILLVLGAGFASIYVIDALVRGPRDARWSALVPGAIFAAIGAGPAAERRPEVADLVRLWPLVLVALGTWLLIARMRRES